MRKNIRKSLEWLLKNTFTVFSCVGIIVLGMGAIAYATTIGTNIATDGSLNAGATTITGNATFSGSVGIGTTNPSAKLDVFGAGGTNVQTAISVMQADDGAGHAGGKMSLVSQGWGEWGLYVGDITDSANRIFYGQAGLTTFKGFANGISFVDTNANPLMRISNAGNVGIASTSPYAKLSITNIDAGPSFLVEDSASPDSTPFVIDASGKVGIGTASPGAKIHINSGNSDITATFESADTIAYLGLKDSDGTNFLKTVGNLFSLANGSGAEKLTVNTSSGNIGVGTTTPTSRLSVHGAGNNSATYSFDVTDSNYNSLLSLRNDGYITLGKSGGYRFDILEDTQLAGHLVVNDYFELGDHDLQIASNNASNFIVNSAYNQIDSGVDTATISGGGRSNFQNLIGTSTMPRGIDATPLDWTADIAYVAGSAKVSTIAGGYDNIVNQLAGTIIGGGHNFIKYNTNGHSIIGGGSYNVVSAGRSGIFSGSENTITGNKIYSFIGGGNDNNIVGNYSVIPGGLSNAVNGDYSFAFGRSAQANADGVMALSDSSDADFSVATADVFGARYSGGYWLTGGNVGIGTTTPGNLLDVYSTATTTIKVDSNSATQGGCLKIKDSDGSGYSYCTINDGTLSCSTTSCE